MTHFFETHLIDRIGWTLVHSIWQILIIAVLVAIVNQFAFRRSPNGRYATGCIALMLMVLPPIAMFSLASSQSIAVADAGKHSVGETLVENIEKGNMLRLAAENRVDLEEVELEATQAGDASPEAHVPAAITWDLNQAFGFVATSMQPAMPSIVLFWILGVVLLSVRPLVGAVTVYRLRRSGQSNVSTSIVASVKRLSERMGIRRTVEIAESALVQVPAVVGSLRPLLLLPASMLTGLTADQIEAVLAHELAHIRRHDYLVNLIQSAIETVLFYHPAVWWVSRIVRQEREHCCDDMAIAICQDRATYATALVALDGIRAAVPQGAVAANGGSLLMRIRRIVRNELVESRGIWPLGFALFALIVVACVAGTGAVVDSTIAAGVDPVVEPIATLDTPSESNDKDENSDKDENNDNGESKDKTAGKEDSDKTNQNEVNQENAKTDKPPAEIDKRKSPPGQQISRSTRLHLTVKFEGNLSMSKRGSPCPTRW